MIILAKAVSYGGNSLRYAMEKENAKTVKLNYLPDGLDPTAIWYMMKHHCLLHQSGRTTGRKLERLMVNFVISPSKEESANFTMSDWVALHDEALDVIDSLAIVPKDMNREVKTNFRNSMNVGALHTDSKSGTLHLHIDCCRVDLDGNTNDVHDIHIRAMKAAEIINMRHGWKQPKEIRAMRKAEIARICENTLRNMPDFDIHLFFRLLRKNGYEVMPRYDSKKRLVGYTIGKNASVFKASEIGRKFMVSTIETTWQKLHPKPEIAKTPLKVQEKTATKVPLETSTTGPAVAKPSYSHIAVRIGNDAEIVRIPTSLLDIIFNESQVPDDNNAATKKDVMDVVILLFLGYVDAATSISVSCGGGGSAPQSGWGKKDDEDERQFARRCIRMAHSMIKPRPRYHYHR